MNYRETPLFIKAEEILAIAMAIAEGAPDDPKGEKAIASEELTKHMLEQSKGDIMQNAMIIQSKIAGAYGLDMYDLQMENACLIRKACRDMLVALRGLEMAGYDEQAHFDLLRNAVKEFRPLFVEWIHTFKDSAYFWDEWEVFNPPGAVRGDGD